MKLKLEEEHYFIRNPTVSYLRTLHKHLSITLCLFLDENALLNLMRWSSQSSLWWRRDPGISQPLTLVNPCMTSQASHLPESGPSAVLVQLVWCGETLCKHAERLSLLSARCVMNSIFNMASGKRLECKIVVMLFMHQFTLARTGQALLPFCPSVWLIWSAVKSFVCFL